MADYDSAANSRGGLAFVWDLVKITTDKLTVTLWNYVARNFQHLAQVKVDGRDAGSPESNGLTTESDGFFLFSKTMAVAEDTETVMISKSMFADGTDFKNRDMQIHLISVFYPGTETSGDWLAGGSNYKYLTGGTFAPANVYGGAAKIEDHQPVIFDGQDGTDDRTTWYFKYFTHDSGEVFIYPKNSDTGTGDAGDLMVYFTESGTSYDGAVIKAFILAGPVKVPS